MATAPYRVEIKPSALDALRDLPQDERKRIGRKINALAGNPRPPRAEKLEGGEGLYRIRSGDYRVIYQIEDDRLLVLVVRVAHRRESYRNL